jgi:acyl-coenzyme A thioesterase PaaI-like protein
MTFKQRLMISLIQIYPPILFSGIRVRRLKSELPTYETSMKLRFFNQGIRKTHFGGSLYSMTDPFFMLILMEVLGSGYNIWDQAGSIEFVKPARRKVTARFEISLNEIENLKRQAALGESVRPIFEVEITDDLGQLIAKVSKTVYVRKL